MRKAQKLFKKKPRVKARINKNPRTARQIVKIIENFLYDSGDLVEELKYKLEDIRQKVDDAEMYIDEIEDLYERMGEGFYDLDEKLTESKKK